MNCVKPDHPCYVYTYPSSIKIDGFGNALPRPPSLQSDVASFIPFSSFYGFISGIALWPVFPEPPAMKGGGRRFDTFRYIGPG
jgi:hypothetical protein